MVDWVDIIPTIIGSGLVIFVLQFVVGQQVLVPNIKIDYDSALQEFNLTNIGIATAKSAVITITWNESIAMHPTLFSTNFVQNGTTEFSPLSNNMSWQVQVPRISPGKASIYMIEVPSKPEILYVTYEQGSKIWPSPRLFDNPINLLIFILLGLGIIFIASSLLFRFYKRRYYRFKFLVKIANDMNQVAHQLRESPFWTQSYWTTNELDALYSTRKWDIKNKILRKSFDEADALLFDLFYGRIVSRDITINKILDDYYLKRINKAKKDYDQALESSTDIKEHVHQNALYLQLQNSIIKEMINEREKIHNETIALQEISDPAKFLPSINSEEAKNVLTKDRLLEIHKINQDLRLTAEKCFKEFQWSKYNVAPKDLDKVKNPLLTLGVALTIVGVSLGIAIGLIVIYMLGL